MRTIFKIIALCFVMWFFVVMVKSCTDTYNERRIQYEQRQSGENISPKLSKEELKKGIRVSFAKADHQQYNYYANQQSKIRLLYPKGWHIVDAVNNSEEYDAIKKDGKLAKGLEADIRDFF